jgi:hypothetical protein
MLHRMNGRAMVRAISQPVHGEIWERATARPTASGAATTSRCAASAASRSTAPALRACRSARGRRFAKRLTVQALRPRPARACTHERPQRRPPYTPHRHQSVTRW